MLHYRRKARQEGPVYDRRAARTHPKRWSAAQAEQGMNQGRAAEPAIEFLRTEPSSFASPFCTASANSKVGEAPGREGHVYFDGISDCPRRCPRRPSQALADPFAGLSHHQWVVTSASECTFLYYPARGVPVTQIEG